MKSLLLICLLLPLFSCNHEPDSFESQVINSEESVRNDYMNGHSDLVITDPIATTDSLSNSDQDEEVENPGDSGTKGENKYNLKLIDSKHPSWDVKPVNFAKEAEKEST